ncbi:MAG: hypothetical protein JW904_11395 [Spirochaetales bacterium]|nr:hypothetical protein [Spirochaetales bacterium]
MRKIQVDMSGLIYAVEDQNDSSVHFLDTQTGEVISIVEDFDLPEDDEMRDRLEESPDRFLPLEPMDSSQSFEIMEDFVRSLPGSKAKEVLHGVLCQPKPFRRFKDSIGEFPNISSRWLEFHDSRIKEHVVAWLGGHNIQPV